jgi:hypothetical protein
MTTVNIKDAGGASVAIEAPLPPGRAAAAASKPVALSTEDLAALAALATAAKQDALAAQITTLLGHTDGIETLLAAQATAERQDALAAQIATLLTQTDGVEALLASLDGKSAALVAGRTLTDTLGQPGVARQQAATTSPATITLTTTVRRVSIAARTSNLRYVVGTGSVVANASTSHWIAAGERLDIAVPANGLIGVIRDTAATADGVLEVTEL